MELEQRMWRGFGGVAIGIIVLKVRYPFLPGNVANASSFNFPVLYETLEDITVEELLCGAERLEQELTRAARRLEERGVRAIVGACGSFAPFQDAVSQAVRVPVFLSILLQIPFILAGLGGQAKLGVLMASAASLTPRVQEQCGITSPDRLVIREVRDLPEFAKLMGCAGAFDPILMEQEIVSRAVELVESDPNIRAIVLQCSDLPPFAAAIQRATGLAVFDMTTLTAWLEANVVRRPFVGPV